MPEKSKTSRWYIYDGLKNDRAIAGLLLLRIRADDIEPNFFARTLYEAQKAREINALAKKLRVKRETLYPSAEEYDKNIEKYKRKKVSAAAHRENIETALNMIKEMGLCLYVGPAALEPQTKKTPAARKAAA